MKQNELEMLNDARTQNIVLKKDNEAFRASNGHLKVANAELHRTVNDLRQRLRAGRFDADGAVPMDEVILVVSAGSQLN